MSVIADAAAMPQALNMLPAAAAVAVLCGLVIAEIAALPGVLLPGGTVTLLAGALIGAGRPAVAVAVPLAAAVIGGIIWPTTPAPRLSAGGGAAAPDAAEIAPRHGRAGRRGG